MASGYRNHYSQGELDFLRDNSTLLSRKELAIAFNSRFKRDVKQGTITELCKKKGWLTGRSGRFEKGCKPWNTGNKGVCAKGVDSTWFKKGGLPHNTLPVYSKRITKNGYIEIKTDQTKKWEYAHRIVWEQHNGEIPDNHFVTFKDGDHANIAIENLELCSHKLHAVLCKSGYYSYPKELKPSFRALIELRMAINKVDT